MHPDRFLVLMNINPLARARNVTGIKKRGVPEVMCLWWTERKNTACTRFAATPLLEKGAFPSSVRLARKKPL